MPARTARTSSISGPRRSRGNRAGTKSQSSPAGVPTCSFDQHRRSPARPAGPPSARACRFAHTAPSSTLAVPVSHRCSARPAGCGRDPTRTEPPAVGLSPGPAAWRSRARIPAHRARPGTLIGADQAVKVVVFGRVRDTAYQGRGDSPGRRPAHRVSGHAKAGSRRSRARALRHWSACRDSHRAPTLCRVLSEPQDGSLCHAPARAPTATMPRRASGRCRDRPPFDNDTSCELSP